MDRMPQWRRQWHPTPVLLPGKSHGWRRLVDCSPWGHKESDTTKWLHFHALEKELATHSSVLAWRIPGMGKPGGLAPMVFHRVGHGWSHLAACRGSWHLQTVRVLLLFQSGFLLFHFLLWLLWPKLPKLCWIVVVRVGTLVLFLTLGDMLSFFSSLRIMFAVGLSYMGFIMLRYVPSIPAFWRFFF